MAENRENTPLVHHDDTVTEPIYGNLDFGDRRPSLTSVNPDLSLTLDELLYRIQYAFLDKSYDVESDVSQLVQKGSVSEIDRFLQCLNATPLPIQQKLNIAQILHTEGNLKHRYTQGNNQKIYKRQDADSIIYHLWDGTITQIAAYFGSNVASYFRFVRTLVYINVFVMMLMIGFVVVPELIEGNFQTNVTYARNNFGDLSNSIMYYGLYTEDLDLSYNLPLAYFLTWVCANLFCFVAIITIMIVRYRRSKMSDDRINEYKFAWKLFCTWDHSITSRHGVIDFRTSYKTEMKELVREEKSTLKVDMCTRLQRYVLRLLVNIFVLGVLVGGGYLIYKVAKDPSWSLCTGSCKDTKLNELVEKYQLTFVVAGLKFIVPPMFEQLVVIEGWQPRTATKFTLARTTVFYIASVLTFAYSLLDKTLDCDLQDNKKNSTLLTDTDELCCWENEIGEEILKVILVDLGILIAVGMLFHLQRAMWVKCSWKVGFSKFNVVSCVLDVIYGQCLVWLGLYFSPLIAALGVIKLIFVFYVRYFIAKVAMVPPQQLFRASSTGNFYLGLLLLNFFISIFPMTYAVIESKPSKDCGPFINIGQPYNVITDLLGTNFTSTFEDQLKYIQTPAVLVPVIILLVMMIVYFKVKSSSYRTLISELRRQLKFERKVEKRKIFATGRAMSGSALSRYTSADGASTPGMRQRKLSQQTDLTTLEEEDDHV